MPDIDYDLKEHILSLSDDELRRMVYLESGNYTDEAIQYARAEAERRGLGPTLHKESSCDVGGVPAVTPEVHVQEDTIPSMDQEFKERIPNLSDDELIRTVYIHAEEFRDDILQFAKTEAERRGLKPPPPVGVKKHDSTGLYGSFAKTGVCGFFIDSCRTYIVCWRTFFILSLAASAVAVVTRAFTAESGVSRRPPCWDRYSSHEG